MARGSLEETLSHISFCYKVRYISDTLYREMEQEGEKLSQLINGYIAYLKRSKKGADEPGANYTVHDQQETYSIDPPNPTMPNTE
jgi:hypothetical protein